jgi:hypothetical protein
MSNTGHFWTPKQEQAMLNAWRVSGKLKKVFAREYAKECGFSVNAIYSRLLMLTSDEAVSSPDEETAAYEQGEDFINIVCASKRMLTKEDVIKQFQVDENIWAVDKFKVKTSEGYRKDRKVDWHVKDGVVESGDVEDTGRMLVVPLYHVEVRFIRKTQEIRARNVISELIIDAQKAAPRYPVLKHTSSKAGLLYEIGIPDLHFGRLTWEEETGEDYDIKIARGMVENVLKQLLAYAEQFRVSKILLPIGNDFFNVNNKEGETTHGTRQQEDTRWQKTFRAGRMMAVNMIDACAAIAPVDVLIVPGNHDEERMFYLGDALDCWYHNAKRIAIDNRAIKRKYYSFGANLIGFTHGSEERKNSLTSLMPLEVPQLWAASKYREWHTGDKHHKTDMVQQVDENLGVVVRILRSLAPADAWTFDKGFVGAIHAAESFLWHPANGIVAQFTAVPQR